PTISITEIEAVPRANDGTAGSVLVMPILRAMAIALWMPVCSNNFTETVLTDPARPPSIEYLRSYVSSSVFSGVQSSTFVYSVLRAEIYAHGLIPSSSAAAYRIGFNVEPTCRFV